MKSIRPKFLTVAFSSLAAVGCLSSLLLSPAPVRAQEAVPKAIPGEPTADEIVGLVHLSRALQKHRLEGELNKDGNTVPFSVMMEKDLIRFYFENPKQIISLDITQKGSRLNEIASGSNQPVPAERYASGVRGTDLTYDDISFRYLYWPKRVKQPNLETVKTRKCWVVDVYNPERVGAYGVVRIFVDRESGGLMRMMGYDWQGQLIKVCAVTSGMKIDGATVLKSMDVITYVPGTKKVSGETEFELKKP